MSALNLMLHEALVASPRRRRRGVPVGRRRWALAALAALAALLSALVLTLGWQAWRLHALGGALGLAQQHVAELSQTLRLVADEAPTHREFDALRSQLADELGSAERRMRALESGSVAGVVGRAAASVALIQGSFALRHRGSGKMLRLVVVQGEVQHAPDGSPEVTLGGAGPLFEFSFSGTAFVVDREGTLMTNRHVVLPWEEGEPALAIRRWGLEPRLLRMRGYLPGQPEPFDIAVVDADDKHDLALLRGNGAALRAEPLRFAAHGPAAGDTALVLGYPTGVRGLLARAGEAVIETLRRQPRLNEDRATESLARAGMVHPLVSRGIVAQVAADKVVYDAQTTSGGSGGPVLNARGEVVAVNRAVQVGYGGSNIGVAAEHASRMLAGLSARAWRHW